MPDYNSMQASAGLMPQMGNQLIFPGQFAAAIAAQNSAQFTSGGMFPSQTFTPGAGMSPLFQGPTGFLTPMNAGAPFNPYAPPNPFANLVAYGSTQGRPSPFSAYAPNPPPSYAGLQGTGALPFAPPPMASPFDTPYGSTVAQAQATSMRGWAASQAGMGSAFRVAPTLGFAAIGGMLGGPLGAAGGALLGEASGLGHSMQNAYANYVTSPRLAIQGAAQGFEHLSQRFAPSGSNLNPSGSGFSHHASLEAAQGLSDLSNSASFRRETQNRFNQQDVFKITQGSIENGLMSGASTPQNVTARVREIAKSLSAFMELAKEPDIQRAIQTMGSLRNSGLNLQETMSAVASGRTFARMAGSTFQGLSEIGGAIGSQTYQNMGLTQGLGFQSGMGAYGQASASINQGILNPQVASLVGGREGLAGLNAAFSGSQLQLPMTAMGLMGRGGGLSAGAVQNYLTGGANPFSLTSQGTGALSSLAGRMGVGGMGMAIGMQALTQDSVGRILESQGPFARRNVEDRSIMNLMRQMGMSGSEGFMTSAQMLGMQGTAAMARTQELQSGAYWDTQQDQLRTNQREARAVSDRRRSVNAPRTVNTLLRGTGLGDAVGGARDWLHHAEVGVNRALGGSETHDADGSPTTDSGRRRLDEMMRSDGFRDYLRQVQGASRGLPGGLRGVGYGTALARAGGSRGVMAALDGLFMGNDAARDRAAQDYQAGGNYASNMLSTTTREQARAMGRLGSTFGSTEALGQFTQRASALAQNANSASRVAVSNLTGGLFSGSRAIAGSSIQRAFRDTLRQQGISDAEIDRRWSAEGSTIAAQHSLMRTIYGETDAEREAWNTTAEGQSRFSRDGAPMRRIRGDADTAYRRLMGDVGREGQEAFRTISDAAEGLGPEGSRRNQTSRRLMTGLAMTQISRMSGGRGDQRASMSAADRMMAQARREGLSEEDIALVGQRAAGISRQHHESDAARAAARGFVGSGADLSTIGETDQARMREVGSRQVLSGFAQMARGGGALGDLFKGLDESNFSGEEVQRRIAGASNEQIEEIRRMRGRRGVADAMVAMRRGDRNGAGALFERAGREGRDSVALGTEYDREHGTGVGAWFQRQIGTYDNARARWVNDQLRTTSPEERAARAQSGESQDARGAASQAGIGRAGDALLEASRELNEVTRNLREVSQSRNIEGLVGRPM